MGENIVSIWIPVVFPSRNESEGAARSNKYAGASLKKRFTRMAELCIRERMPSGCKTMDRYSVSILWVCKDDKTDPDNVLGGIKYVMDGLVAAGLVAGDRWKNVVKIENRFVVRESNPGVHVYVMLET